ncbi:MAG TPA: methyltransferase domain-containing protein [Candidatus Dormibacteraeota bacterium]|nr:methyltransferase domain-containing protein [Candidatus Dormibacteraeota bacterium]
MIAGVFSRYATAYRDRLADALDRGEARGRARVLELLNAGPGWRVLDLGCGPGVLTRPLAAAVGPTGLALGVDLAEGMLRLAAANAPGQLRLARMDMERLGLVEAAFDAVACGHSLQFCPSLAGALAEIRRVLRPGGRVAASLPAAEPSGPAGRLLDEVVSRHAPRSPEPAAMAGTRAALRDPTRTRAALTAAGFRSVTVERVAETASYAGPAELVDSTLSWWTCAWRLESVTAGARERLRAEALAALRSRLGTGPVTVPGASIVLSAVNPAA